MLKKEKLIGSFLVVIMFSAALLIPLVAAEEPQYDNISVQQAHRMIKNNPENVFILDVRNQSEYDVGHLYNAFLVPVFQLENVSDPTLVQPPPSNSTFLMSLYEKTKSYQLLSHINDKIIVYCHGGSRSAPACQILVEHGFTKVYNMIGGISAWMQADLPMYTSYHHVSVGIEEGKTVMDVVPWLSYQGVCGPCQNQTCSGTGSSTYTNITTLEESENHTVLLATEEVNGSVVEHTIDKTLLFSHSEIDDESTLTTTFVSTVITTDNTSTQGFGLDTEVQGVDYNLTLLTILQPLNDDIYNSSITTIKYVPFGEQEVTSIEQIDFNNSVTLSQLYKSLGKVAKNIGKIYGESEDVELQVFADRYYRIEEESGQVSRLIEQQIPEYDKTILNNKAVIVDDWMCDYCPILCPIIVLVVAGGCWAVCFFGVAPVCGMCVEYFDVFMYFLDAGCVAICGSICSSPPQQSATWLDSIITVSGNGNYAVDNPDDLIGPGEDGASAHLHACNYGDCAQITGGMSGVSTGDIYIYGCSGSGGYYSDLYVYVSSDYYNWDLVDCVTVTATSPYTIYIGYASSFSYVAIAGYDSGCSVCLYLDAVSVVP